MIMSSVYLASIHRAIAFSLTMAMDIIEKNLSAYKGEKNLLDLIESNLYVMSSIPEY